MQPPLPLLRLLGALALGLMLGTEVLAQAQRTPDQTRAGERAPDFALATLDGKGEVRLADYRGVKPVVLIFGSYTCPPFRDVYPLLERLFERFGERVAFHYVYIREAHPEDGWKIPRNQRDGIQVRDPQTQEERVAVAEQACAYFETRIPALVDGMDNAVDRAYAAWPSRIFVVDVEGRIAVQGEPGPRGLRPAAEATRRWLEGNVPGPAGAARPRH